MDGEALGHTRRADRVGEAVANLAETIFAQAIHCNNVNLCWLGDCPWFFVYHFCGNKSCRSDDGGGWTCHEDGCDFSRDPSRSPSNGQPRTRRRPISTRTSGVERCPVPLCNRDSGNCLLHGNRTGCQRSSLQKPPKRFAALGEGNVHSKPRKRSGPLEEVMTRAKTEK